MTGVTIGVLKAFGLMLGLFCAQNSVSLKEVEMCLNEVLEVIKTFSLEFQSEN